MQHNSTLKPTGICVRHFIDVKQNGKELIMQDFALLFLWLLLVIAAYIFVVIVVWRAMRAHERIANAHEKLAQSVNDLAKQMQSGR